MSDIEENPEVDPSMLEEEVDTLFMKTQVEQDQNPNDYLLYVPISVQLENDNWNVLTPSNSTYTPTNLSNNINDPVVFPGSRIRKLMKMDPSVKIISKQALSVMSKATSLFVDILADKTEKYLNTHDSKQVKTSTIIQVCKDNPSFQFLLDDLILEEMDSKRIKVVQEKVDKVSVAKNNISSFFQKKQD